MSRSRLLFVVVFVGTALASSSALGGQAVTLDGMASQAPAAPVGALAFEPNLGQHHDLVEFVLHGGTPSTFFTRRGVSYVILEDAPAPSSDRVSGLRPEVRRAGPVAGWGLQQRFVDARAVVPIASKRTPTTVNRFVGAPSTWVSDVPTYSALTYPQLWPGIDLVYRAATGALKYEYLVSPGTDPSVVRTRWVGADEVSLAPDGSLVVTTPLGQIHDAPPVAWQDTAFGRRDIDVRYRLQGRTVAFALGEYDPSLPLVIDPAIAYSNFLGGSDGDAAAAVAVDSAGAAYVAGDTNSTDFPIVNGAFSTPTPPTTLANGFVAKVNPAGTAIEYATYLGGSSLDFPNGIAIDASGAAYVTGRTSSADFPTTAASFDPSHNGSQDAFIAKFDPTGALVYSGLLGGSSSEVGYGIAVDSTGVVHIAGSTSSSDFPTTLNAAQPAKGASGDAFVTRIDSSGASIAYSTYLGGSGGELATGIALDPAGASYIAGWGGSPDFPTTPGAFAVSPVGTFDSSFAAKVDPSGSLAYSTYLGGSRQDFAADIAVDATGAAYVIGGTHSADYPTKLALDPSHNGGSDVFLTKLDPSGASLEFSTFIGAGGDDYGTAVAIDGSGAIHIAGDTDGGFPTTADAFDDTLSGSSGDSFVTSLTPSAGAITFSTFLGGDNFEFLGGIAVTASGDIIVAGETASSNYPTTAGPFDTYNGRRDAFVAKFAKPSADLSLGVTDAPDPVQVGGTLTYTVTASNAGPSPATGVSLSDTLPAGVTFGSAVPSQGTCSEAAGVVSCSLGTIAASSSATVTITVTPTTAGTLTNSAKLSATEEDPNGANNTVTTTTTASPASDLSLSVTDAPDPVQVGGTLTYTVTASNAGPSPATGVSLSDTLPAGVTFGSAVPSQGTCSEAAGVVSCSLGTIAASSSATVTITVTPTTAGTLTNSAKLSATEDDPDTANNTVTTTTTASPASDLSLSVTDAPDPVQVGGTLTYTVTASNAGPSPATGVSLSDTLPAGVTFGSAVPSQGTCSEAAGVVSCSLGTIAASSSATVTITVTPTTAGTLTNSAKLSATEDDPNGANNTVTTTTTVTEQADVSLTKTASDNRIYRGEHVTYTLTVANGGSTATGVTVTDRLPPEVSFERATPSQGTCSFAGGVVTCSLGSVADGASATVRIEVDGYHAGNAVNTACVRADQPDPDGTNNCDSVSVKIRDVADLEVDKVASSEPALVGHAFTYTIRVHNSGPSDADDVVVTDPLPAGLDLVSTSVTQGSCGVVGSLVRCELGDLDDGDDAEVTIEVIPTQAGSVRNTAEADADTHDDDDDDDTSSATTTVVVPSGLSVTASASKPAYAGQIVTHTLKVSNAGPATATGVELDNPIPEGSELVSISTSRGTCDAAVRCSLGNIADGGSAVVKVHLRPAREGHIVNTARVWSASHDGDARDNLVTTKTRVEPAADLWVRARASSERLAAGDQLVFVVDVLNDGPSGAERVVLNDHLPRGYRISSAEPSEGTCTLSGSQLICEFERLDSGATVSVRIEGTVEEPGEYVHTPWIEADTHDPRTWNNTASSTTIGEDVHAPEVTLTRAQRGYLYLESAGIEADLGMALDYAVIATPVSSFELRADAFDDFGVAAVAFYVDGEEVCSDAIAPYTCAWVPGVAGLARVEVEARDAWGNVSARDGIDVLLGF